MDSTSVNARYKINLNGSFDFTGNDSYTQMPMDVYFIQNEYPSNRMARLPGAPSAQPVIKAAQPDAGADLEFFIMVSPLLDTVAAPSAARSGSGDRRYGRYAERQSSGRVCGAFGRPAQL